MTCPICSQKLDPAAGTTHPTCAPWADDDSDPEAALLKHQLIEIITWADRNAPRSLQQMIGPSEIGVVCDRRIGYRIAEITPCNVEFDPWPAIVGTAIHRWLDDAVVTWSKAHADNNWLAESQLPPLQVTELVEGHGDLFHVGRGTVIDHKTAGPDVMRLVRQEGAKPEHKIQVQCYGLGFHNRGYTVNKVAIIYYPRSGWLGNCQVWVDDFRPDVAYAALDRLGSISRELLSRDVLRHPEQWSEVSATPSNECGLCPWYDPNRYANRAADETGCPGK